MKRKRSLGVAIEIAFPLLLIGAWWLFSSNSHSFYYPSLSNILSSFRHNWLFQLVPTDVLPSLERLSIGYGICVVLGIACGVLIGSSRTLAAMAAPIIEFLRALPPPALIPFGILVLGVGNTMKIFIIVLGSIWPILLGTIDGIKSIDPVLLETVRTYRLPATYRFRRVLLPAASPQIFAGMRTGLSLALILMIVSELVASTNGIGYFVLVAERTYSIPAMWSGILLLGILGYLLNLALTLVERRVLRWHRGAHMTGDPS